VKRTRHVVLMALLAVPAAVWAQNAPPAAPGVTAPPRAGAAADFVYEVGGRRDPFVDLLETGAGASPRATQRGEGAAGLTLSEISISGVVQSQGLLIAMIQGPDKKTYLIHPGDKLADGVVSSVNSQGIIVLQDIQDRLAPRKQREVKKLLRSLEGARE
jgi:Tfp pilus assembly protein PilP